MSTTPEDDPDFDARELAYVLLRKSEALDGLPLTEAVVHKTLDQRKVTLTGPVTEPDFVITGYVPRHEVTLLSGVGGSGKSYLLLQWLAAYVSGRPFLNCGRRGKAVLVSAEDPAQRVKKRIRSIAEHWQIPLSDLDNLTVLDFSDGSGVLFTEAKVDGVTRAMPTEALADLDAYLHRNPCELLALDNASDLFEANANDPLHTRRFIRALKRLALHHNCGIVLLGHTNKASKGGEFYGTTAWSDSVRSRLTLLVDDQDGLTLRHDKTNYGPKQAPVQLERDQKGILRQIGGGGLLTVSAELDARREDDRDVLTAIQKAIAQGFDIPAAVTGPATGYRLLTEAQLLPKRFESKPAGKRLYQAAVNRLLDKDQVRTESYQKSSYKAGKRLVSANPPMHRKALEEPAEKSQ